MNGDKKTTKQQPQVFRKGQRPHQYGLHNYSAGCDAELMSTHIQSNIARWHYKWPLNVTPLQLYWAWHSTMSIITTYHLLSFDKKHQYIIRNIHNNDMYNTAEHMQTIQLLPILYQNYTEHSKTMHKNTKTMKNQTSAMLLEVSKFNAKSLTGNSPSHYLATVYMHIN